ncbi:MAG: Na+/H+ antiporter subunit E [Actinomycetota bacterium]|nr:Na+/H+ antiporter subunit E [Actinomycetota bacterium]
MSRLVAIGALVGVYALTMSSFHPLDLALGALLAVGVLAWGRRAIPVGRGEAHPLARLLGLPRFLAAIFGAVVGGTWHVALMVVGVRSLERSGIVAVPIGERTRSGVAASALALTLSPGEVLIDVDWERGVMLIHSIDARDPNAVRERHDFFYRRRQREIFP